MRPLLFIAFAVLAAIAVVAGQAPAAGKPGPQLGGASKTETAHLHVAAAASGTRVAPGARLSLYLDITPKPRMHVYSPEQKDVVPISLKLEAGDFRPHAPQFPKPERYFFEPLKETQLVYSKPFRIVQHVTIAPAARAGAGLAITGTLRYQACDDAICYMPVTVPVSWTLR